MKLAKVDAKMLGGVLWANAETGYFLFWPQHLDRFWVNLINEIAKPMCQFLYFCANDGAVRRATFEAQPSQYD